MSERRWREIREEAEKRLSNDQLVTRKFKIGKEMGKFCEVEGQVEKGYMKGKVKEIETQEEEVLEIILTKRQRGEK